MNITRTHLQQALLHWEIDRRLGRTLTHEETLAKSVDEHVEACTGPLWATLEALAATPAVQTPAPGAIKLEIAVGGDLGPADVAAIRDVMARSATFRAAFSRASSPLPLPVIGQPLPAQGGLFAGIARGIDGAPDEGLILSDAKPDRDLAWQSAIDWAAGLQLHGFSDWHLFTRDEGALLYANVRDQFESGWHWTSTQYSRNGAWLQSFGNGYQIILGKKYEARARAVRRFSLQSLTPSTAAA